MSGAVETPRDPPRQGVRPAGVAYLVNQYPAVSHSFIRREVQAMEGLGLRVERFTVRRWPGELRDPMDRAEASRTEVLLEAGALRLLTAELTLLLTRPVRWCEALHTALRTGRRSDRGVLRHLMYHAEACLLLRLLEARRVSHLHAHFGTNSATVALLCRRLGGPPFSFTIHGADEADRPLELSLPEKTARASFVVAVSRFGRSQLWRWCAPELWSRVHVVHCGLDAAFLEAEPSPVPSAPRLVCVGRLCKEKGQLLLLRAVARLVREGKDLELVLVGDGDQRSLVEAEVSSLGLTGRVRITGFVGSARVISELRAARALVLPSFVEGLPVVIMEALALGRPVVSTYVAGIPELVVPGEHGWLVPPGSVEDLAQALAEVLAAPTDRLDAMGRAGAAVVRARHSSAREAEKLAALIRGGAPSLSAPVLAGGGVGGGAGALPE